MNVTNPWIMFQTQKVQALIRFLIIFMIHQSFCCIRVCNNSLSPYKVYCLGYFYGQWFQSFLLKLSNTLFVLDEFIYFLVEYGFLRGLLFTFLSLSEMVMFKIIYLYKYSRIAVMDEYFLSNFVTFFNFLVIFCFTVIRIQLGEHKKTRTYFKDYAKPSDVYRKIKFP